MLQWKAPNLYVQVSHSKKTGKERRSWVFRYHDNQGKPRSMGLGSCAAIDLATARKLATHAQYQRQLGQDPLEQRRISNPPKAPTLQKVTDEYLKANSKQWSDGYVTRWEHMFDQYLFNLCKKSIDTIKKQEVINVLKPVFENTPRQGTILQRHLQTIFEFGIHREYCKFNPAHWDHLKFEFKNQKQRSKNHPALEYKSAPAFYKQLQADQSMESKALRILMLTALRVSEVLKATWAEIDWDEKLWIVPAWRMKMRKEFKIPLPDEAIEIFRSSANTTKFIFPISSSTVARLKDSFNKEITLHGMRASFRTWADEETSFAHEVKEAALAHKISSEVERAYVRGELLEKRRALINEWTQFLTGTIS